VALFGGKLGVAELIFLLVLVALCVSVWFAVRWWRRLARCPRCKAARPAGAGFCPRCGHWFDSRLGK